MGAGHWGLGDGALGVTTACGADQPHRGTASARHRSCARVGRVFPPERDWMLVDGE
jgi:hypothetical protein